MGKLDLCDYSRVATKTFNYKPYMKLSLLLDVRPWEAPTMETHLRQQWEEMRELYYLDTGTEPHIYSYFMAL